jgi:GMP synthase-like glutamine amidotransferase
MILLISTCENELSIEEFVKPIQRIINSKTKIVDYSRLKESDLQNASKVIICGTALKDFKYLEGDWSWIKTFSKPLLGICAGMQVIAQEFNGKLIEKKSIGMKSIKLDEKLYDVSELQAYELHNLSVASVKGFKILAQTKDYIQIMIKDNFMGIIFHPEVRNQWVIEGFCKL